MKAVRFEGIITLIGVVTGWDANQSIFDPLKKIFTLRGIFVGSKELLVDMMRVIEDKGIQPVVDKTVFPLSELKDALKYMEAQKHTGKIVIKIV